MNYVKEKNTKTKNDDFLWNDEIFKYFKNLVKCTGKYAKFEIFDFFSISPLEIDEKLDVGANKYPAILLKKTGKYELYECSIQPYSVIKRCHVLRKDGWEFEAFQRTLSNEKLKDIFRELKNKDSEKRLIFSPTNIVIGFTKRRGEKYCKPVKDVFYYLHFPKEFNSISIIDGQHRLLSLTKANKDEKKLIKKVDLTAYVIVFKNIKDKEKIKEEARVFVDINEKQTQFLKV